jgi:hypothetical protein
MNSKFSIVRSIAVAAALVAGASGMARADDNSTNPFTGESYAYFNGCNLGQNCKPAFDKAPSAWRQSHPNGLTGNQIAALSTSVFKPAPVLDNAPSAWRQSHPSGLSGPQFAALGSEAITARPTNDAGDMPSASLEPFGARIARFFHVTPANQATPAN